MVDSPAGPLAPCPAEHFGQTSVLPAERHELAQVQVSIEAAMMLFVISYVVHLFRSYHTGTTLSHTLIPYLSCPAGWLQISLAVRLRN